MQWTAKEIAGGVLLIGPGLALIVAGTVWKGRAVRPYSRRRALTMAHRAYVRDLSRAADLAIGAARRAAGEGEPAIVTVADVERLVRERYGHEHVERSHAAAALRRRFHHHGCAADCVTDAYV
ncbi:hypothetical protein ACFFSH_14125 [Streptomyces filamentosus]|uniref:Uncharacterized protein n=1 Tax=Streptomyces filamentosus TaxID=67294 RepID=A0A919EPK2_STRFL|nr:hypothetical protein [Streptomyces filamentosus]GHG09000.1 hypothetical protein GCM10017667_46510 [Streptomyces filamentosus]